MKNLYKKLINNLYFGGEEETQTIEAMYYVFQYYPDGHGNVYMTDERERYFGTCGYFESKKAMLETFSTLSTSYSKVVIEVRALKALDSHENSL